jgi:hypothetical protein
MLSFFPPEIRGRGATIPPRGLELYHYTQVGSGSVSDNPTYQDLARMQERGAS